MPVLSFYLVQKLIFHKKWIQNTEVLQNLYIFGLDYSMEIGMHVWVEPRYHITSQGFQEVAPEPHLSFITTGMVVIIGLQQFLGPKVSLNCSLELSAKKKKKRLHIFLCRSRNSHAISPRTRSLY